MASPEQAQRDPTNGDFWIDRNRDLWGVLPWAFCGGACQAWILAVGFALADRPSGMLDPCACHRGHGCAVQQAPVLPCIGHNDPWHGVLSPMQAKTSGQADRQTRRAERSSRSSTRTGKGKQTPSACLSLPEID